MTRSAAFYRDVLVATALREGEPLRLGDIWLTIHGGGGPVRLSGSKRESQLFAGPVLSHRSPAWRQEGDHGCRRLHPDRRLHTLKDGTMYQDLGCDHFKRHTTDQQKKRLVKRLSELGYAVELKPLAAWACGTPGAWGTVLPGKFPTTSGLAVLHAGRVTSSGRANQRAPASRPLPPGEFAYRRCKPVANPATCRSFAPAVGSALSLASPCGESGVASEAGRAHHVPAAAIKQ
jgi:hypothetical protein